jgi:hypothetical protein
MPFGATLVFKTLTKGQQISNKNCKSDLDFEFEWNLIEFSEFDSNPWLQSWLK